MAARGAHPHPRLSFTSSEDTTTASGCNASTCASLASTTQGGFVGAAAIASSCRMAARRRLDDSSSFFGEDAEAQGDDERARHRRTVTVSQQQQQQQQQRHYVPSPSMYQESSRSTTWGPYYSDPVDPSAPERPSYSTSLPPSALHGRYYERDYRYYGTQQRQRSDDINGYSDPTSRRSSHCASAAAADAASSPSSTSPRSVVTLTTAHGDGGAMTSQSPPPFYPPFGGGDCDRSVTSAAEGKTDKSTRPIEIEIEPGLYSVLRGSDETWEAILDDMYMPSPCLWCQLTVFAIQDCGYVLCPGCKAVFPVDDNNGCMINRVASGVGLGFTFDNLIKWQPEVDECRRARQRHGPLQR